MDPFLPNSPGPLYQNEVKCSAFDMEMIFHSHANKTHLHKKGCALGLILKVRVFGTRKWPFGLVILPLKNNMIGRSKMLGGIKMIGGIKMPIMMSVKACNTNFNLLE